MSLRQRCHTPLGGNVQGPTRKRSLRLRTRPELIGLEECERLTRRPKTSRRVAYDFALRRSPQGPARDSGAYLHAAEEASPRVCQGDRRGS